MFSKIMQNFVTNPNCFGLKFFFWGGVLKNVLFSTPKKELGCEIFFASKGTNYIFANKIMDFCISNLIFI